MPGKALKAGSGCLYSWSGLNFFLSSLILIIVLSGFGDSPLLDMVFEQSAIDRLDAQLAGEFIIDPDSMPTSSSP